LQPALEVACWLSLNLQAALVLVVLVLVVLAGDKVVPVAGMADLAAGKALADGSKVLRLRNMIQNSLFGMRWNLMRTVMVNLAAKNF